ncbi:MAG: agmatine deiminase family protein [Solirubrobacterales bacterium]|nr:agmatine deiminase family protein [Solirubrobacterales bacterium]
MSDLHMPAEWAPHEMTLVAWPQRDETWRGTTIEDARDSHTEVIAAISEFEPVLVVADPSQADSARSRLPGGNVEVLSAPIDDSWLRDSGPIIVTGDGRRAGVDFVFNSWGEAFLPYDNDAAVASVVLDHLGIERIPSDLVLEGGSIAVNGEGTLVTTEQCLLDPTRNPGLDRESIGAELKSRLGVSELVWLEQGLVEDGDTDGHVDNICAFIDPGKVLLQSAPEGDPNFENAQRNLQLLTDAGIEVVELDLLPRIERDGEPIVVPYTNFYIANGALIVPVSGVDPDMDAQALELLGRLYPDREAIGIDGRTLALGGGGIHCITQQIPAA